MWVQAISLLLKEFLHVFPEISASWLSAIPASFNLGCSVGCYIFAAMTDKYGRSFIFKKTIYLTCISAVVLILCNSFWQIVVSCFFLGLGIGGDIAIPPSVFIESIAPSMRARATLMNMGYCIGPVISSICMQCSVLWWVGPFAEWKFFLCIIAAITVILILKT